MDEPLSNSDLINWWAGFRVFVMKNLAALIKQDELADKDNSGIPTTGPSYRDTFEWLNDHRQFDVSAVKEFLNGDIDIPYDIDLLLKHYASLNPDFNKYTPERIFEALSEIYFGPEEDEENIMPLPEKSPEDRENLGLSNDESPANTKNNKGKPLSKDLAAGLDTDLGDTALDLYQNYKDTGDERYLEQAKALSKKMGQRFSAQSLEIQLRRAALVAQASTMGLNHGLVSPRKRAAAASDTDDSSTDLDSDEEPSFGGKQFVGFVKPNIRSTEGEGTQATGW